MDEEDIVWVVVWATCLTGGCGNFWEPIHTVAPDGGDILCGPCGEPVTNITDIEPTEGRVLPEWISEMLQTQNSDN